ncbi:alpha/beta-hydrolase [Biscogniauxia mediterranea]|nr:alpha/beta-hydrolase [Biscogniauxia mediterranea]
MPKEWGTQVQHNSIIMTTAAEDAYLAKPPGACCLEGTLHSGEPRGISTSLAGVETYVCAPAARANGNIVLYFPDVWGFCANAFLVMDGFADAGYLVVGLDYFRGDPVWKHRKSRHDNTNPDFDYEAWKRKHVAFADVKVPEWVSAVKARYGKPDTKYACVGYCFGAPYVCNELAGTTCAVGAVAHPAFLAEHHFQGLNKPLFLSCSEVDHTFPMEYRNRAISILTENKKQYHLQLFSGVEHGFALRGDMNNPYERWVKYQSLKGIIAWFDFWLSQ